MDIAKSAYVKAEELEAYLRKAAYAAERRNSVRTSKYPRTAAESGYAPASVVGSGNAALTVSATVRAPQGADGIVLWLYCGDKAAAYTRVTLPAGGQGNYTLLAAVYPQDGERIQLIAEREGLLLDEVHVLAEGDGVSLSGGEENVRCDYTATAAYVAREKDGYLTVRSYPDGKETTVAHASVFDIACLGGEVGVLCRDDDGNVWGVRYDAQLKETGRTYLGDGVDKVTLGLWAQGLLLAATTSAGDVLTAQCERDFSGKTDWAPMDFDCKAQDIYLAKQSENPLLFLQRDGAVFCKPPLPQSGTRDYIAAHATLIVGGTNATA